MTRYTLTDWMPDAVFASVIVLGSLAFMATVACTIVYLLSVIL